MISKELTPNETIVFSIIHELGEADTHDILNFVNNTKDWKYTNVESFLTRLWEKGYVTREREGRRYRYKPKQSLSKVVFEVLDKLFVKTLRDKPVPLLNYLFFPNEFTEREIKMLKNILFLDENGNEPPPTNEDGNNPPADANTETLSQ